MLDLELRQLPGVSFAVIIDTPRGSVLQVVTVDPLGAEATATRASRLAARYLDEPVHLEVWLGGAPKLPLAVEGSLSLLEGVSTVAAVRGSRGELTSLSAMIDEAGTRASIEDHIRNSLAGVPDDRLFIEVVDEGLGQQNTQMADH